MSATTVPVLYLMVGLPGSGKTTRAWVLAAEQPALRMSPDEWMIPLFGDSDAGGKRDVLEGRLIRLALEALAVGTSVVLDFGFWGRDERTALRWLARESGARSEVVYLDVDHISQAARVAARLQENPASTFAMTAAELERWRAQFEPPDAAECSGGPTSGTAGSVDHLGGVGGGSLALTRPRRRGPERLAGHPTGQQRAGGLPALQTWVEEPSVPGTPEPVPIRHPARGPLAAPRGLVEVEGLRCRGSRHPNPDRHPSETAAFRGRADLESPQSFEELGQHQPREVGRVRGNHHELVDLARDQPGELGDRTARREPQRSRPQQLLDLRTTGDAAAHVDQVGQHLVRVGEAGRGELARVDARWGGVASRVPGENDREPAGRSSLSRHQAQSTSGSSSGCPRALDQPSRKPRARSACG